MKMQVAVLFVTLNVLLLSSLSVYGANQERHKRSPDKYDDHYNKFISKHFGDTSSKYIDSKDEYKNVGNDSSEEEEAEGEDPKESVESHGSYSYHDNEDYQRIKALSEAQVAKLQEKPGNCKHFEKDGMICAECKDPETGDTSESCAFSSEPNDKKVAYLSKKSHNYKSPNPVEVEEPVDDEKETEQEEEAQVTPSAKVAKPAKQYKSEIEDAGDYGAYKLAGDNSDVDDYDDAKFAQLKVEPKKNEQVKKDFEILPQSQFQTKNLNQALTDFHTKDWSKCNKVMKGDMTCYYCKDAKGATQEECMFISSTNPKNLKVERHESKQYDHNSRKPLPTSVPNAVEIIKPAPLKVAPVVPNNRERFARMRMGRPLMPTKAIKSEPLVTPKSSNIDPVDFLDSESKSKKTIKRTVSYRKRIVDDFFTPFESRAGAFETHVHHDSMF